MGRIVTLFFYKIAITYQIYIYIYIYIFNVKLFVYSFFSPPFVQELLAIQQQGPRAIGFFGTRNMGFMHQELIEILSYAMVITVSCYTLIQCILYVEFWVHIEHIRCLYIVRS
jgi:hypothetical protein